MQIVQIERQERKKFTLRGGNSKRGGSPTIKLYITIPTAYTNAFSVSIGSPFIISGGVSDITS